MTRRALVTLAAAVASIASVPIATAAAPNPTKVVTGWIDALAMDGPNVAYSAENASDCRNVVVWNVLTGKATRVSGPASGRCGDDEPDGQLVGALAIAGDEAAWIRTIAGNTESDETLFAGSIATPREHQLATARRTGDPPTLGTWLGGLAGSGTVLAASAWRTDSAGATTASSLRTIAGSRLTTIATDTGAVAALSTDLGRIAVLRADGTVALLTATGTLIHVVTPSSAKEIALRKDYLLVLTKTRTLEIYNSRTGAFIRQWPVAAGAAHLDLYAGIAVYATWRTLHAIQLTTGRDVAIASLKRAVVADGIEAPGVVYAYDTVRGIRDFGNLVFVPMRAVALAVS